MGGAPASWACGYQRRYQDGPAFPWLTEDEARDSSSSPRQLDVFHATWEACHGSDKAVRPPGTPTKGKREVGPERMPYCRILWAQVVGRSFFDPQGNLRMCQGKVCDLSDPCWWVEYPVGDWEELTRREIIHGIELAAQPPVPA